MLCVTRKAQGTSTDGETYDTSDEWQFESDDQEWLPWTGKTIFIVDATYSKDYGIDHRRQRKTAENGPKVLV